MKRIKNRIKRKLRFLVFQFMNWYYCKRNPLDENKVLFLSDVRASLGGNLKYVYDNLEGTSYNRVVVLKEDRKVKRTFSQKFELCYELSTAKYIFLDDYSRFISLMKVRPGQEICQLWHGAGAFKKFGYSRSDKTDQSKADGHRNYTKACVTGEDIRWCFAEGFGMNVDGVRAVGMPRTDLLFDQDYIERTKAAIYEDMPYFKDKKIILFAPTYRGSSLRESYYDFDQLDVDKIYNELKDKGYVFVFKWHPGHYFQMKKNEIVPYDMSKYEDFFYDLSDSRDINEMLLVADVLITDYSSVIFDYAILKKPIVYFTYDYEEYTKDRGLYFDFDQYVYGEVAKNTDELIASIENHNMCDELRGDFYEKFMGACDGHCTDKICRMMLGDDYRDR